MSSIADHSVIMCKYTDKLDTKMLRIEKVVKQS